MRTTLDIEDDILSAAKELAKQEGTTAGQIISALARKGLISNSPKKPTLRGGVPVLPSRGEIVTMEKVQRLMDEEGV